MEIPAGSLWLWLTDIAMVKPWPIEIDGFPNWKMVIYGYQLVILYIAMENPQP